MVQCVGCGYHVEEYDVFELNGDEYCEDCYQANAHECERCREIVHIDDTHNVYCTYPSGRTEEIVVCENCYDEAHECEDCGDLWFEEDMTDVGDSYSYRWICPNCIENYYRCRGCDSYVHVDHALYDEEDGEAYCCEECLPRPKKSYLINDYSYKPSPKFYGTSKLYRFYGIELEIDGGGKDHDEVEPIYNAFNGEVYFKEDGSLDDGFEIVSHPATYEYHMRFMNWEDAMRKARRRGYKSHDTDTCGLHIHVDRRTFGKNQEYRIGRLLYLIEKFWPQVLKFSRRSVENMQRWANSYGIDVSDTPKTAYDKAKSDSSRYRVVNLNNRNTVEIRAFRGTLVYSTFQATLQFVHHLINIVMSNKDLTKFEWDDFKRTAEKAGFVELINYINERGI